jgi:uncharacterized membrane protein
MNDEPLGSSTFADWRKLPPVEQARVWEKIRPGTFEDIWIEALAEGRHRRKLEQEEALHRQGVEIVAAQHHRRIDWFVQSIQMLRILGALASLLALVYVGTYFAGHHAPTQGASIFGAGGVALVGLFLGSNPNLIGAITKAKGDSKSEG